MALPIPVGRQSDVLSLPSEGHFAVLGTAGSGKTIMAVLRADYLGNRKQPGSGPTLLLTFNKALLKYIDALQREDGLHIDAINYHRFALGYLRSRGHDMDHVVVPDSNGVRRYALRAVKHLREAEGLSIECETQFLVDEVQFIAQSGCGSAEDYSCLRIPAKSTTASG